MAHTDFVIPDELTSLRQESLRPVLAGFMVAAYLWYVFLFPPANWLISPTAWVPLVLMIAGLSLAFIYQRHNLALASIALISSIAAAILYSMWQANLQVTPYLLAIVVSLTGLFFNMRAVGWVTLLCCLAVVIVGFLRWTYSPIAPQVIAPVVVVSVVGILSSLTVRNLYLALSWTWERARTAQQIEEELRNRQAELGRTLKALDEAYHRLGRLNYDLAWAREMAEQARETKQRFAANVSHELRTPLNVILAFSEMMYFSPESYNNVMLPPEYRGDVREVYRSSKHLLSLVDDVLDLSQIEVGHMKLEPKPARLNRVVAEALGIIRPLLRGKKIELQTTLAPDLPAVLIDRDRVRQVLVNLLNNARRFTEQGGITIYAVQEAEYVKVTVADTGIGIALNKQKDVFKEFRQIDSAAFRSEDGSGLGLAISKRFIEMHGGRIWLESEGIPGQGSRFHFTLPLAAVKSLEAPASSPKWTPLLRQPAGRAPSIVGGSVAVAVMWREIFGNNGLINFLLAGFGIPSVSWLGNPRTAIWTLIVLAAWQFGSPMLIFLAGLKQIPAELYEAASIDGGGGWAQFTKITLPLLTPVIFFNLVMQIIAGFMVFTQAFIVTLGKPLDTTLFYTLYLYQRAFRDFAMGYSSAMAWVLLLIVAFFTALVFKSSSYWVYYESGGDE